MITSESPATHSRSFRFGVKATFVGFGAGFAGVPCVPDDGLGIGRGVDVAAGGTTIATLIVSSSPRPIASFTSFRGRSSSRA